MPQECQPNPRISLIPGFAAASGLRPHEFGTTSAKLLAFLTLQQDPTERAVVAGTLWPEVDDARAAANLRTALWRVGQLDAGMIVPAASTLVLDPLVRVDYRCSERLARLVLTKEPLADLVADFESQKGLSSTTAERANLRPGIQQIIQSLTGELLTHWYDDWLGLYQERWRQLRLHALDSLSIQLTEAHYHADAVDSATAAVAAEPLRESGYRSLMVAHVAEGNVSEAVRTYEHYATLLDRELGIAPSVQMCELLSQTTGPVSTTGNGNGRRRPTMGGRRRAITPKRPSERPNVRR